MRYLLIVDLTLTAFAAAMTIAMGFVSLVFASYRNASEKMQAGLSGVLIITACFISLFFISGLASLLLRRRLVWHWAAQALVVLALPVLWQILVAQLQSP